MRIEKINLPSTPLAIFEVRFSGFTDLFKEICSTDFGDFYVINDSPVCGSHKIRNQFESVRK